MAKAGYFILWCLSIPMLILFGMSLFLADGLSSRTTGYEATVAAWIGLGLSATSVFPPAVKLVWRSDFGQDVYTRPRMLIAFVVLGVTGVGMPWEGGPACQRFPIQQLTAG